VSEIARNCSLEDLDLISFCLARPLTEDSSPETESPPARTPASALMRRELQGEGVGIKPVGDRKSYHLQGAEDDDDTR